MTKDIDFCVPNWPRYTTEDIEVVSSILTSGAVNYWSGTYGRKFEDRFGRYVNASAVAVSNGTVALEACMRVLEIKPGDEVIVTPRSFIASASVVAWLGAVPVFCDVERDSQCIDPVDLERKITAKTRAVIVVHFAGHPADMDSILSITEHHNISVIEDCAQAHGAKISDKSVGAIGAIAAWSFCSDKIISTGGEGGMVTSKDPRMVDLVWQLKDHGKNPSKLGVQSPSYPLVHDSLGTNWRMTEVQCAIGLNQLQNLPSWGEGRRQNLFAVWEELDSLDCVRIPRVRDKCTHAAYKGYFFVRPDALKPSWSRNRICVELQKVGVPAQQGSCSEIYLEGAFEYLKQPRGVLPVAHELGETAIAFPVHQLIDEHIRSGMIERLVLVLGDSCK